MRRLFVLVGSIVVLAIAGTTSMFAGAEQIGMPERGLHRIGFSIRAPVPAKPGQPGQHGSSVVVEGQHLWVAERVSGVLVRCDHEGRPLARISLHPGLGELILDPAEHVLYVADRAGDRVVRIDTTSDEPTIAAELTVREPHGLALTPDGATLLVTSVADHSLIAIDRATLSVRWQVELASEPRGVAVAPDGASALVGFLSLGAVARVDLASAREHVRWHALDPRDPITVELEQMGGKAYDYYGAGGRLEEVARLEEAASRFEVPNDIGGRFARNTFVLGFVGDGIAIVPHQLTTPQIQRRPSGERGNHYGGLGGQFSAVEGRRAWLPPTSREASEAPRFEGSLGQVRALAYDAERDILYLGDYAGDWVVIIQAASQPNPSPIDVQAIGEVCGIDGLALAGSEGRVWVHCELTRKLIRFDASAKSDTWLRGPELAASARSPEADRGAELFRRDGDMRISADGSLACATCHPEGRSDGLSWRLGSAILQTPILAGRLSGTAPYKWDGRDPELYFSMRQTITRLGGQPSELRQSEYTALQAYLLALPAPRSPSVRDAEALGRGQRLFEHECAGCHAGEWTTDNTQHPFTTSLPAVDTPSLIGVAHTAPYFHDGSAHDLAALLDDRGSVHDMVDTSGLSLAQRDDLTHYLESL